MATGKRKVHSAEFKAKVALEAVKGVSTVNEIAQLSSQFRTWTGAINMLRGVALIN